MHKAHSPFEATLHSLENAAIMWSAIDGSPSIDSGTGDAQETQYTNTLTS